MAELRSTGLIMGFLRGILKICFYLYAHRRTGLRKASFNEAKSFEGYFLQVGKSNFIISG